MLWPFFIVLPKRNERHGLAFFGLKYLPVFIISHKLRYHSKITRDIRTDKQISMPMLLVVGLAIKVVKYKYVVLTSTLRSREKAHVTKKKVRKSSSLFKISKQ